MRNALLQDPWMRFCHAHMKLCWQSCLSPDEKQQNEKFLLVSDEVGVVPAMQKPPFQRGRLNVEADLCTFFFSLSLYGSLFGLNKWVCLKMLCTPKPNGFADHYPCEKWL